MSQLSASLRKVWAVLMVGASVLPAAYCTESPAIDGNSDAAFESSHAALVKSLSPEDQLRFALAELIFVNHHACTPTTEPIPNQPRLTAIVGGLASMKSCRTQLNGQTFQSIMSAVYPKKGQVHALK